MQSPNGVFVISPLHLRNDFCPFILEGVIGIEFSNIKQDVF